MVIPGVTTFAHTRPPTGTLGHFAEVTVSDDAGTAYRRVLATLAIGLAKSRRFSVVSLVDPCACACWA